jgi:transposase
MLKANYDLELSATDQLIFAQLVPSDHYLRQLKAALDFTPCRALVAECYAPNRGRGAIDPVRLLKLLLLGEHYALADEKLIQMAQVNVAFRFFLDWPLAVPLPEPSLLSQFRTRLGTERFQNIFHEILRQARAAGLVQDRLRLKDATHVIANVAIPATLALVAQMREKLLEAAAPFAPAAVAAHRQKAAEIRHSSRDQSNEARLLRRVNQLRELVAWGHAELTQLTDETQKQAFAAVLAQARKVLNDREPQAKDQVRALSDPDARRNKHGEFYDGYLCDVMLDADSELITALDILPANADEAANAQALIAQEENAHGNDIPQLSIDAIGYNGAVLQALSEHPQGPQVTVFVPPKEQPPRHPELFQGDAFTLNDAGDEVTCPQGETTRTRSRDGSNRGWVYHFRAAQCRACPLRAQCLTAQNKLPRKVSKNDFQAQYTAAQQRATTDEYQQIRKEHPAIERKLNELVRWHQGRRVRYRGRWRVQIQFLLLGLVVNCKRIVRLLLAAPTAQPA